jgi:lipase chaperone LimK
MLENISTANIIREKSRTDPKGLWKILNNIDRKKSDVSNNVTLEQFVEYFKNLNELPENEKDQEIDFDDIHNNFCSIEFYKVYLHFSYQSY